MVGCVISISDSLVAEQLLVITKLIGNMGKGQNMKEALSPEQFIPSNRAIPSPENWIKGKAKDDNIGDSNLWRIHNKLYNLNGYMDKHPGGPEWLQGKLALLLEMNFLISTT